MRNWPVGGLHSLHRGTTFCNAGFTVRTTETAQNWQKSHYESATVDISAGLRYPTT